MFVNTRTANATFHSTPSVKLIMVFVYRDDNVPAPFVINRNRCVVTGDQLKNITVA